MKAQCGGGQKPWGNKAERDWAEGACFPESALSGPPEVGHSLPLVLYTDELIFHINKSLSTLPTAPSEGSPDYPPHARTCPLPPAPSTPHSNELDGDGDFTSHFLFLLPTTSAPCPRHGSLTTETSLATKPSGEYLFM